MKEISAYDQPLYRNFVKPEICRHLQHLGLTSSTPYQWKVRVNETALHTHEFDIDQYYLDGVKHIDKINPPIIAPAYTIADCMMCFNLINLAYIISCEEYHFKFSVIDSSMVRFCPSLNGERLPDVLALALQNLIYSAKIDLQAANIILTNKNFVQQ